MSYAIQGLGQDIAERQAAAGYRDYRGITSYKAPAGLREWTTVPTPAGFSNRPRRWTQRGMYGVGAVETGTNNKALTAVQMGGVVLVMFGLGYILFRAGTKKS